jgi:hypothetical protein
MSSFDALNEGIYPPIIEESKSIVDANMIDEVLNSGATKPKGVFNGRTAQ